MVYGLVEQMEQLYKYGDCILQAEMLYKSLKGEGKHPKLVKGWVELDEKEYMLPDEEFLKKYKPEEYAALKDPDYDDYTRAQQHTWVEVNGKIIDPTKNQFDEYGGPKRYYVKKKYDIGRESIKTV